MSQLGVLVGARLRMARNRIAELRHHSLFKIVVIACFAVGFWVGLLLFFYRGFEFLFQSVPDLRPVVVDVIFSLFFFSLTLMLFFSNGIIAFTSLFRSEEARFLFSSPVCPRDHFTYRLFDGLVFSSWAFLFMGLPLLIAHGVSMGVAWYFYPVALLYFVAFVFIPAALGSLTALLVGRYFAHRPVRVLAFALFLALLGGGIWFGLSLPVFRTGAYADERWVLNAVGRFSWTRMPLLPSWWMSRGILSAAAGRAGEAGLYFLVVLANALFLTMVAQLSAGRLYEQAYHHYHGVCRSRRRRSQGWLDRLSAALLWPFPERQRYLVIKDIRTFCRDPVQWSQALIFFGLLGVYLLNMRSRIFGYHLLEPYWKNLVSFLNLTATSLTLSTFTSRFVFPLLSLEGRRFWVLGMVPLERRAILLGKFYFALLGSFFVAGSLMVLSDTMLQVPLDMVIVHLFAVLVICCGLSALSVGLGAIYPMLNEDNPSKIVSGFGGALNLVLSMVFVGLVVALLAVPIHLHQVRQLWSPEHFRSILAAAMAVVASLGIAAVLVPLRLGLRAFERLEV